MYWTKTLIPTMKETPEGAEVPSHIFMLRAGLVGQIMAGAYAYLPLGLRSLHKAAGIIREEMNSADAVELLLSALTPISLWEKTGRVDAFGDVLIKFDVRRQNHNVTMALGPTHEEIITELISRYVSSYRQMPITLYQIQNKFRNEERPRFGVLRTSEFLMKDAYSFNTSLESLDETYDKMYAAYCKIFDRCGFEYLPVEAESGPIGGDASHEFMIPAENGEDSVAHCSACGYAANLEKAELGMRSTTEASIDESIKIEKVDTPEAGSITAVCAMLGCQPAQMIKTLIYSADERPVVVLLRGDHEANENKIRRAIGAKTIEMAEPEMIKQVTGAPVGFAGPVGLADDITIWADLDLRGIGPAVTGANEADLHFRGAQLGRDFKVDESNFADLRNAAPGDPCPRCSGKLAFRNAIEVGHVFKLGTKYTESLSARFLDDAEKQHPIIMGCYGIGVNRILAGLVETSHDDNGIIWPVSLAPYEVLIDPMKIDEETLAVAADLQDRLEAAGVDCLIDDRKVRAGVKFNDADLIGIPMRIVLGPRGLKEGKIEVKWRWDDEAQMINLDSAIETLTDWLDDERKTASRFRAARKA
jgi:prolyl-tRNA synthetase